MIDMRGLIKKKVVMNVLKEYRYARKIKVTSKWDRIQ